MAGGAFTVQRQTDQGGQRLLLQGHLTLADGAELWQQLQRELEAGPVTELDLAGVHLLDGAAAALLLALRAQLSASGRTLALRNASGEVARVLALYDCGDPLGCGILVPRRRGILAQFGDGAVEVGRQARLWFAFVGDLVAGLYAALRRPRTVHCKELPALMERAGADGLPIVLLINFLVGVILGLQGAKQLHRFGADALLANLVGLSVVRELGPLMTAILVAGRSGAAYAAELGTMTVNEEVDALRTLGQDPQRFLVFPRVLALFCVVPLLTVLGNAVGCLGGMFIALVQLATPPVAFFRQLREALQAEDVLTGLIKSGAYAAWIGLVACQRGLAARGGAQGVGIATTKAVVGILFGLVLLDAAFTLVFSLLDW